MYVTVTVLCRESLLSRLPKNLTKFIYSVDFLEPIRNTLGVRLRYPPDLEVVECPPQALLLKYGLPPSYVSRIRGGYDKNENNIYLINGKWCLKTLIHESLHAASYFAYGRHTEIGNVELINEGITEYLTGFVLFRNYLDCYSSWLNKENDFCRLIYDYELKLIAMLAQHIGINDIIRLYIWQPETDWRNVYVSFLSKFGFKDVLFYGGQVRYKKFTERFRDEVERVFRLDLEELEYDDVRRVLNYQ